MSTAERQFVGAIRAPEKKDEVAKPARQVFKGPILAPRKGEGEKTPKDKSTKEGGNAALNPDCMSGGGITGPVPHTINPTQWDVLAFPFADVTEALAGYEMDGLTPPAAGEFLSIVARAFVRRADLAPILPAEVQAILSKPVNGSVDPVVVDLSAPAYLGNGQLLKNLSGAIQFFSPTNPVRPVENYPFFVLVDVQPDPSPRSLWVVDLTFLLDENGVFTAVGVIVG